VLVRRGRAGEAEAAYRAALALAPADPRALAGMAALRRAANP